MQTVEMFFNDTIEMHRHFKKVVSLLIQEVPLLSPIEIQSRCAALIPLQRELTDCSDQFCLIIGGMGPDILETPYIGELQRGIDKSVIACDALHAEILLYRTGLDQIDQTMAAIETSSLLPLET